MMSPIVAATQKANVVAFLNPWFGKNPVPQLEVLIDWTEAAAWGSTLPKPIEFDIYVVQGSPRQVTADKVSSLGSPVLTSADLIPLPSEDHLAPIRAAIDGYLHPAALLANHTFPSSSELNSIAEAKNLSAFSDPKVSEPIAVPHPTEFHLDPKANSLNLLKHVARLRLWQENVRTRAKEAETNSRMRILSTGVGTAEGPILEALRSAARSEPIFGRVLNVLHFFDIRPDAFRHLRMSGNFLWLYARPKNIATMAGVKLSDAEIMLTPTRVALETSGACSYLEQDAETKTPLKVSDAKQSFEAPDVTAHQLISPAVLSGLPPNTHRHVVYTAKTKEHLKNHVAGLTTVQEIQKQLRLRSVDAAMFKAKCLNSIEDDVYGFEHIDRAYDSIGVVWDRKHALPTVAPTAAHVGYKGFRVDLASKSGSIATGTVEKSVRFSSGEDLIFSDAKQVSLLEGYLPVSCQRDPTLPPYQAGKDAAEMDLILPRNFLVFDGYNTVSVNPLDGLVSSQPDKDVSDAAAQLVAVVNRSASDWMLKYGNDIGFYVRKVALTGMSARLNEKRTLDPLLENSQRLTFQRYVPIQAPGTEVSALGMSSSHQDAQGQGSNVYNVHGSSPQFRLRVQCPLAHYKLLLHSVSDVGDLGDDFNDACRIFLQRTQAKQDVAGFLRGLDPHASHIDVISTVWFPFSTNPGGDRYIVTGTSSVETHTSGGNFADLIVKAQKMLNNGEATGEFAVHVAMPGSYDIPGSEADSDAQILAGLRNRLQCRGRYDEKPVNSQLSSQVFKPGNPNAVRSWTLNPIIHTAKDTQPIGGDVGKKPGPETLRGPARVYASLHDARLERYLSVPPTQKDGTASPIIPSDITEPSRGTPFEWRGRLAPLQFSGSTPDDKKNYYSANRDSFDIYRAFLQDNILKADLSIPGQGGTPVSLSVSVSESDNYPLQAIWAGSNRQLVVPGFNFPRDVGVTEVAKPDGQVEYRAKLAELAAATQPGSQTRHLPFADDEIVWVVRVQWRIDLKKSKLSRPYDIAAVKEFQVYRREIAGADSDSGTLIATLKVPSLEALRTHDLDQVWWVLFDGVTDRSVHRYGYRVVAIPKDELIFASAKWFDATVDLPCSRFDPQPEKLVALPVQANPNRGFAFLFNAPAGLANGDSDKFRVAVRTANAVGDPLLATDSSAAALQSARNEITEGQKLNATLIKACSDAGTVPTALQALFPSQPSLIAVENQIPDKAFATDPGSNPQSVDGWTWVADLRLPSENGKIVISHFLTGFEKTKNPFLQFHFAYYLPTDYPRLRHTAASDFVLSDWVQAFPDDLLLEQDSSVGIKVKNAWEGSPKPGAIDASILFRFHVFVANSDKAKAGVPAFHVSSFYMAAPAVSFEALRAKLKAGLTLMGIDPSAASTNREAMIANIVAEEGLWAMASADSASAGALATKSESVFVVLRGTSKPFSVNLRTLL